MRTLKLLLMRANHLVRVTLFRRRAFVRLLFGVEVIADSSLQTYCEWATILLRLRLHRHLEPGYRVLDLGTGAQALVAILAKRICPEASVLATDILPERVEWAHRTIAKNRVDVECRQADLFQGISGRFDLILLTPPAIPSGELRSLGFEQKTVAGLGTRYCWSGDGGQDGLDVIRPFLGELAEHLTDHGRGLVCVNPLHCSPQCIRELCERCALVVEHTYRLPGVMHGYVIAATAGCANPSSYHPSLPIQTARFRKIVDRLHLSARLTTNGTNSFETTKS